MTNRGQRPDPALAALVKRDIYGNTDAEEQAYLRSDEMLERFQAELHRTVQSVQAQLAANGGRDGEGRDEEWRANASWAFAKYSERLAEVNLLCRDLRDRWRNGDVGALQREVNRLRGAIALHRKASEEGDVEPEAHDFLLWASVVTKQGR